MKILKHISTKARRKKVYDCEVHIKYMYPGAVNYLIRAMDIQLKVFGLFWWTVKKYSFQYFQL